MVAERHAGVVTYAARLRWSSKETSKGPARIVAGPSASSAFVFTRPFPNLSAQRALAALRFRGNGRGWSHKYRYGTR